MTMEACLAARGLGDHVRVGLQALGGDSRRVTIAPPRSATHSVDLDQALKPQQPRAPRWDYAIALKQGQTHTIAWVEVHTATSGEVDAVLNKLAWLRRWLTQTDDACRTTASTFHWVATDAGVHIDSARRRRLNATGLSMPRSLLRL